MHNCHPAASGLYQQKSSRHCPTIPSKSLWISSTNLLESHVIRSYGLVVVLLDGHGGEGRCSFEPHTTHMSWAGNSFAENQIPSPCPHPPVTAQLRPLLFGVSRKLMQLKKSDVLWCVSDPGWILAAVGALFEPWTTGSTLFIHHMPQFDPKVIIKVRRPISNSQYPKLPEEMYVSKPKSQPGWEIFY